MSHTPLAPRDLLILAVLADAPQHGYGIIKAVEDRSVHGVLLDPANLYRALRRMRRDGWIDEVVGEETEPRKRTFGLTPQGRTVLKVEVRRLESLLATVRPRSASGGGV